MSKRGEWEVKKSKLIYQNPWIAVREDSVIRPDGGKGIYGTVEIKPGAVVMPLDSEGNIYLLKSYLYAINESILTVAGGGIDEGESAMEAAQRELKEEMGISAQKLTSFGIYHQSDAGIIDSKTEIFLAEDLEFGEADREGTEVLRRIKMTLDDAVQKVLNGEISHPLTAILILVVHHQRNK